MNKVKINNQKTKKPKNKKQNRTVAPNHDRIFAAEQMKNVGRSNSYPHLPRADLKLSKCALKYALACSEPFNPKARGVCGVVGDSFGPSQKISSTCRFIMVAGTAGTGFITIQPCLSNDGILAWVTNGLYTRSDISILTANNTVQTGVVPAYDTQIPYSTAQLLPSTTSANNASITGRILSVGVRVTYLGTTMNQGGVYSCLAPSAHYNVSVVDGGTGNNTISNIQTDPQVVLEPIDRSWCNMVITPNFPYEQTYASSSSVSGNSSTVYPYSNGSTYINQFLFSAASVNMGAPIAVVAVSGATSGNTFQVEIIQHIEYAGNIVGALATPSESDVQGGSIVLRAASQMSIAKASTGKKGWDLMYQLLREAGSAAIQYSVPAATNALLALL